MQLSSSKCVPLTSKYFSRGVILSAMKIVRTFTNRPSNCSSFLYHLIFHVSMVTSIVSCGEGKSMEKTAGIHHLWCLKEQL